MKDHYAINFRLLRQLLKSQRGIDMSRKVVSHLARAGEIVGAYQMMETQKRKRWVIGIDHARHFIETYVAKGHGKRGKDKRPRKIRKKLNAI